MAEMSEWLRIMLDEIARKGEDQQRAAAEQQQRDAERAATPQPGTPAN